MLQLITNRLPIWPRVVYQYGDICLLILINFVSVDVMVTEPLSRRVFWFLGRMSYADDLAVVVESGREMQEVLGSVRRNLGSMG